MCRQPRSLVVMLLGKLWAGCSHGAASAVLCATLLAVLLGTSGCLSDSRDKWLRVFFDGVPPREEDVRSSEQVREQASDGTRLPVEEEPSPQKEPE